MHSERKTVPTFIAQPTRIEAAGNKPKLIDEYIGAVNSGTRELSIAHMRSPGGWQEPGQAPEFDEFTIVPKVCCASTRPRYDRRSGGTSRYSP